MLQALQSTYTPAEMEWLTIRNRFIALREDRKLTQEQVADKGKLDQGGISKLESNLNQGPSVETFVKAVEGLGLTLTEFFAQLENQTNTDLKLPVNLVQTPPHRRSEGGDAGSVSAATQRQLFISLGRAILDAAAHLHDDPDGEARHAQASQSKRRAGHRRTHR